MTIVFDSPQTKKAYDFIKGYIEENSFAPTHEELARHLGNTSFNNMGKILSKLKDQNLIETVAGKSRGIRLKHQCSIKYFNKRY